MGKGLCICAKTRDENFSLGIFGSVLSTSLHCYANIVISHEFRIYCDMIPRHKISTHRCLYIYLAKRCHVPLTSQFVFILVRLWHFKHMLWMANLISKILDLAAIRSWPSAHEYSGRKKTHLEYFNFICKLTCCLLLSNHFTFSFFFSSLIAVRVFRIFDERYGAIR